MQCMHAACVPMQKACPYKKEPQHSLAGRGESLTNIKAGGSTKPITGDDRPCLQHHAEDLCVIEALDSGKPLSQIRSADVPESIEHFRYYAECVTGGSKCTGQHAQAVTVSCGEGRHGTLY
jgi:hypothetical protein